jgi:hypothetical protein
MGPEAKLPQWAQPPSIFGPPLPTYKPLDHEALLSKPPTNNAIAGGTQLNDLIDDLLNHFQFDKLGTQVTIFNRRPVF